MPVIVDLALVLLQRVIKTPGFDETGDVPVLEAIYGDRTRIKVRETLLDANHGSTPKRSHPPVGSELYAARCLQNAQTNVTFRLDYYTSRLSSQQQNLNLPYWVIGVTRGVYATGDRDARSLQEIVLFEKICRRARELVPELTRAKHPVLFLARSPSPSTSRHGT